MSVQRLVEQLAAPSPRRLAQARLRVGQVVAVAGDGTVTITLAGSDVEIAGVHRLAGAALAAGDAVQIVQAGPELLVLGPVANQPETGLVAFGTVAFGTGWSNFSSAWADCEAARSGRVVTLQGLAGRSSGAGTDRTVGTLPAGFRPVNDLISFCLGRCGGTATILPYRLDITAAGVMTINQTAANAYADGTGSTFWLSLTGVSFIAG